MALATTDDLEVRLGRALTGTEVDRAEALLAGASARVQTYTGQTFELVEDDTVTVKVKNRRWARLPQRPVVEVTAVEDFDGNSIDFTWLNDDRVQVGPAPFLGDFAFEPWQRGTEVTITYTHGYETIPADIVDIVCQMAGRALTRAPDQTGLSQESIAGYSYSVGGATAAGSMGMLADEKAALDVYRRQLGSIRVAM